MSEWVDLERGNKGKRVKEVQEWLGLHGCQTGIDGDFGPATEVAVKQFQHRIQVPETGVVDEATYNALIEPLRNATADIATGGSSLGPLMVRYARQHLQQEPREIGGQNMGPWVRLYMKGNEGVDFPWCAGFATFIMRQACETLDAPTPIKSSFSCDYLAIAAQNEGLFVQEPPRGDKERIRPGSLFLVRRTSTDWTHTGIVVQAGPETFSTIEGNTNDAGDREGYEVCCRTRSYKDKDFICWQ